MMTECKIAGKALRLVFLGAAIAALGSFRVVNVAVGGIAAILGAALVLYGLYNAVPAHPYYRLAMMMEVACIVISVLQLIFKSGLVGGIFSILNTLAALLSTAFVCSATRALLQEKGDGELAEQARLITLLYALCAAVSILCILVSWVPILNILASITGAITSIVMLVANIIKIIFYYKASRSLCA